MSKRVPKTPEEQAALVAAGFKQANGKGQCCACGEGIGKGQWIRQMPFEFVGAAKTPHHMAHRACVIAAVAAKQKAQVS